MDKYKGTPLERYFEWFKPSWIDRFGSLDNLNDWNETFEEFVLSSVP